MKKITIVLVIFLNLCALLNSSVVYSDAQDKERDKNKTEVRDEFLRYVKSMQIAYVSKGDIWIMRGDGSDKRRITKKGDITILFGWSNDDSKLLFGTGKLKLDPGGKYISGYKLWTVKIKGGETKQILKDKEAIYFAEWSLKEDKIAFLNKTESLWIVDGGGSGLKKVADAPVSQPAWSPDGTKIAYVVTPHFSGDADPEEPLKRSHVWITDILSNSKTQITDSGINEQPMWLNNSKIIIFKVTSRYGTGEHWLYDLGVKKLISKIKEIEVKTITDKEKFQESEVISMPSGVLQKIYQTQIIYFVRINIRREYSDIHWSYDRKAMAFVTSKGEIYIGDSNGENLTKLADKGDFPMWAKREMENE